MTENIKKLNELAGADEALAKRLTEARDKEALTAIAAEAGVTLTEADFEVMEAERKRVILAQGSEQLSDDEMNAVTGGDYCFCFAGGGGVYRSGKDASGNSAADLTCGCVGYGVGDQKHDGSNNTTRCECAGWGEGDTILV